LKTRARRAALIGKNPELIKLTAKRAKKIQKSIPVTRAAVKKDENLGRRAA
jgi:hypothetical protein